MDHAGDHGQRSRFKALHKYDMATVLLQTSVQDISLVKSRQLHAGRLFSLGSRKLVRETEYRTMRSSNVGRYLPAQRIQLLSVFGASGTRRWI